MVFLPKAKETSVLLERRGLLGALSALGVLNSARAAQFADRRSPYAIKPSQPETYGSVPSRFQRFDVILEPDRNAPEWWAGAPAVARDRSGVYWLAARMRNDHPEGPRGYELRLLRSADGIRFEKVGAIFPNAAGMSGFERPALLVDPASGLLKLYGCGRPAGNDGPWAIFKWDDVADLARINPASARPVIEPIRPVHVRDFPPAGYKDPVVLHAEGRFHCYVIGVLRGVERTYHFQSPDGIAWQPVGHPYQAVLELQGWHNFAARPASVIALPIGYLFVYEGSQVTWHDANYNIATGLAFTFDLHHLVDLTPDAPLLQSTTPGDLFHTWRYSQWLLVDDELRVYAEVARPNRTNEIRLYRLKS